MLTAVEIDKKVSVDIRAAGTEAPSLRAQRAGEERLED